MHFYLLLNGKVHKHAFTIELLVFLGEQAENDPVHFVPVVGKELSCRGHCNP